MNTQWVYKGMVKESYMEYDEKTKRSYFCIRTVGPATGMWRLYQNARA